VSVSDRDAEPVSLGEVNNTDVVSRHNGTPSCGSEENEEGWQVVKPRGVRSEIAALTEPQQVAGLLTNRRRALYLSKIKGWCFNCLARDHKVATCRSPTKCWSCRCSGHISTRCSSCKTFKPNHHVRFTHAGNKQPDTASSKLLLGTFASTLVPLPETVKDPMILEAKLACSQQEAGHSKLAQCKPMEQLEVQQTKEKPFQDPERDYNQVVHEPLEDSKSPLLLRTR
jgi:hypothetical protein